MDNAIVDLERITIDNSHQEQGVRFIRFNDSRIVDDDFQIPQIGDELLSCLTRGSPNYDPGAQVCLDFEGVRFFTRGAIGGLLIANDRQKELYRKNLGIVSIIPQIYPLFGLTNLTTAFNIEETRADYLKEYARAA